MHFAILEARQPTMRNTGRKIDPVLQSRIRCTVRKTCLPVKRNGSIPRRLHERARRALGRLTQSRPIPDRLTWNRCMATHSRTRRLSRLHYRRLISRISRNHPLAILELSPSLQRQGRARNWPSIAPRRRWLDCTVGDGWSAPTR